MNKPSTVPYTASKGRRFAITLAGAFAMLGLIAYLRHRSLTTNVLVTLAAAFAIAALLIPSKLEPVERGWMAMAHALSKVTTPIFMGIVYFVVLTPTALIRRMAGGNPMTHKAESDSFWIARPKTDPEAARRRMERQF
ncbi:MAG TPA: SxtJ family membrane protein [Gemmatimonadaceae bacterium]|nr:SxtJ family membrane protein [Gemmatimonadaceae bacterium]